MPVPSPSYLKLPESINGLHDLYRNLLFDASNEIKFHVNPIHQRPYLKIVLQDAVKTSGLYDTGADVSCINAAVFHQLEKKNVSAIAKRATAVFRAANGEPLNVEGQFNVKVKVHDRDIRHNFFVIKDLNEPVILGIDFIEKNGLRYCPVDREFTWKGQSVWSKGVLKNAQKISLSPLSVQVCKVQLRTECGSRPGPGEELLVQVGHSSNPFLTGGPYLIKVDQEGNAAVPVHNCAPFEVELDRNEFLGRAENVSKCEKRQINPSYLNAINANGPKSGAISPEKEEFI